MPNQKTAHFVAFYGMPGCLADSTFGPMEFATRREFVEWVNETLDACGLSRRSRRQTDLAATWRAIQATGGTVESRHSFTICNTLPGRLDQIEFRAIHRSDFDSACAELAD